MSSKAKLILKISAVLAIFASVVGLSYHIKDLYAVQSVVEALGYGGIFLLALVGGFNVVVPVLPISFLPVFIEAGMSVPLVILVISLGTLCGDSVGYLLGRAGNKIILAHSRPAWLIHFEAWAKRFPLGFPIFLFVYASFSPLPNELVVIPAAISGQGWLRVVPPLFLGNLVLNTMLASGISSLFL